MQHALDKKVFSECGLADIRLLNDDGSGDWDRSDFELAANHENVIFWKVYPHTTQPGKVHYPPTALDMLSAVHAARQGIDMTLFVVNLRAWSLETTLH